MVEENKRPRRHNAAHYGTQDGITCAWLYAMSILIVYILQRDQIFGLDWANLGMSHAGMVGDGEWWRAVTALGLHVDTAHLVSNLCFGILFAYLLGEMIGWGLARAGLITAGSLGNLDWIETRPLDDGIQAFDDLLEGRTGAAKIILHPASD